jgi:hypothetical protein
MNLLLLSLGVFLWDAPSKAQAPCDILRDRKRDPYNGRTKSEPWEPRRP